MFVDNRGEVVDWDEVDGEDGNQCVTKANSPPALKPAGFHVDDAQSITFSLALCPDFAILFVNWSEEEYSGKSNTPSVYYQMHQIESFNLNSAKDWPLLHLEIAGGCGGCG